MDIAIAAEGSVQIVQAQVNLGLNPASILGIALAVAGAGLYFLRNFRPELARDHDIFFSAVGLLCGLILLSQGWRLDPILQFGVFLLAGSAVFFAWESIRLRGVATEQAKRSPIVDDDRPVSRVYRAELDDYETFDERPQRRRIRGTRDLRDRDEDNYDTEVRRRPPLRGDVRPPEDEPRGRASGDVDDMTRKRRPRPARDDSNQAPPRTSVDDRPARPSRSREQTSGYAPMDDEDLPPRPRRSRPPSPSPDDQPSPPRRRSSARVAVDEDYVDYQPVDQPFESTGKRGDQRDDASNWSNNGTDESVDAYADNSEVSWKRQRSSDEDDADRPRPTSFTDDDDTSAEFTQS
ncbi:MAG: Ycf66 family protein [Cyanobacteria bacterium]|nr:Ycf66 family protein [Cyanobacteriota bacterium]MDW8200145.1 Ycf66 family protein [Cyanobacteriota bacterium SKYGB_h_bin112]